MNTDNEYLRSSAVNSFQAIWDISADYLRVKTMGGEGEGLMNNAERRWSPRVKSSESYIVYRRITMVVFA
jgi:hypothetical protein